MLTLDEMVSRVKQKNGSDLHLLTGFFPIARVDNALIPFSEVDGAQIIDASTMNDFLTSLLSDYHWKTFNRHGDVDIASTFTDEKTKESVRCRINVFRDARGVSIAVRVIPDKIPSMEDIRLPLPVQGLLKYTHGLIVFTGATGSGKTTSLASMLNYVNENQSSHIITIEDPIEYQYKIRKSIISQREVGRDCSSFFRGLKASLREDPDIILVGELRDRETISTAVMAAETGHLVLTTLHTATVGEAIDRLVQYFPADEQNQILHELALSLRGIVAQRLFLKRGGGRIAAFEILLNAPAIANLIRSNQMFQVYNYMNGNDGMQTMQESVDSLKLMHLIDDDVVI